MHLVIKVLLILSITLPDSFGQFSFIPLPKELHLGGHLINQDIRKIQTDENGSLNTFRPKPFLSGELVFDVYENLSWQPSLGLGLPHSGRDPNIKRWSFYTFFPAGLQVEKFTILLGPGVFFTRLSSKGGTAELDNGTGTDSFFLPEVSSTSANLVWDLAFRIQVQPRLSFRGDVFISQLMNSERRSFSTSFSLHYMFGDIQ